MKERGKEMLLGAILVAIGIVVWVNLGRGAYQGIRGGGSPGGPGGRGPRVDLATLKVFPVDWAALTAARPPYDPQGRNLFQFGAVPAPTPPPLTPAEQAAIKTVQDNARKQQEEASRLAAEQAARQAAEQAAKQQEQANLPPPPPPVPQPPPVPFKFIGYIGPPEHKIAVLHDGTDMIFAGQGDVVGKNFRIVEIGYESIKFGFTDPQFKGQTQTIPMSSSY
jgi:hypothetical protein